MRTPLVSMSSVNNKTSFGSYWLEGKDWEPVNNLIKEKTGQPYRGYSGPFFLDKNTFENQIGVEINKNSLKVYYFYTQADVANAEEYVKKLPKKVFKGWENGTSKWFYFYHFIRGQAKHITLADIQGKSTEEIIKLISIEPIKFAEYVEKIKSDLKVPKLRP